MHGDAAEDAETLKDMIASEFDCASLYVAEFTPVMGAHIGPGLLGVAFFVSPD
jgi:fatty acid-binding protein DegV